MHSFEMVPFLYSLEYKTHQVSILIILSFRFFSYSIIWSYSEWILPTLTPQSMIVMFIVTIQHIVTIPQTIDFVFWASLIPPCILSQQICSCRRITEHVWGFKRVTEKNLSSALQTTDLMCIKDGLNGGQRPGPRLADSLQSHSSVVAWRKSTA